MRFEILSESFKEWLNQFKDKNKPANEESDLEIFLSEFSNQTDRPLNNYNE